MEHILSELIEQQDHFSRIVGKLGRSTALVQAAHLLEKIKATGLRVSNPEQRSILYSLARSQGEIVYNISGQYPSVQIEKFTSKPLGTGMSSYVPFVNRDDEIKLILSNFAPAYYLVDAPAGYGKTELLKELERRFRSLGFSCAYLPMVEPMTLTELATQLIENFNLPTDLVQDSPIPVALRLGGALKAYWYGDLNSITKKGLVLLIDLDKKHSSLLLKELLQNFIPAVQDSLRTLAFFTDKHNRFRVILAGRSIVGHKEGHLLPLKILRLAPFDYQESQNLLLEYLALHDEKSINQLSAHLFYLTGGHPACIVRILEMYTKKGIAPDLFVEYFGQTIWQEIVREVLLEVQDGIEQSTKECKSLLNRLSLFRYLDLGMLNRILQEKGRADKDKYDFADELTASYLFEWQGRFLRDDITRRLLAIGCRHEYTQEFSHQSQQAQSWCAERLQQANIHSPERWTIEYLFQSLQQHANAIFDADHRQSIRQKFLKQDVPTALQMFINSRNIPRGDLRAEEEALRQAMEEDWEFRFTVNYYLRESQYTDEPDRELQQQIDRFFAERSGALSQSAALGRSEVA